jgi:hypothetical protein
MAWTASVSGLSHPGVSLLDHARSALPWSLFAVGLTPQSFVQPLGANDAAVDLDAATEQISLLLAPGEMAEDADVQTVLDTVVPALGAAPMRQRSATMHGADWWGTGRLVEIVGIPADLEHLAALTLAREARPCRWCGEPIALRPCPFCGAHAGGRPSEEASGPLPHRPGTNGTSSSPRATPSMAGSSRADTRRGRPRSAGSNFAPPCDTSGANTRPGTSCPTAGSVRRSSSNGSARSPEPAGSGPALTLRIGRCGRPTPRSVSPRPRRREEDRPRPPFGGVSGSATTPGPWIGAGGPKARPVADRANRH